MRRSAPAEPNDATPTEDARPYQPWLQPDAPTRALRTRPLRNQLPVNQSQPSAPTSAGTGLRRRRRHTITVFGAVALLAVAFGVMIVGLARPVTSASQAYPFPSGGTPLNALTPVTGAFTSDDRAPLDDGKPFTQVLAQSIGCVAGAFVVYATNAGYSVFTASLGLDDRSRDPGATPKVQIYGDGRLLGSYQAAPARKAPVMVRLDIRSVNLLTITWSYPASAGHASSDCRPEATLLIGDPALA